MPDPVATMPTTSRRELLVVLALIAAGVAVRSLLGATFDLTGENFTDQVEYVAMARSFLDAGEFVTHGSPSRLYPPLYPILLAPAAGRADLRLCVLIGSIATSSGLIPLWLIGRRILEPGPRLSGLALVQILPSILLYPTEIFSEALFFPLFWWWAWAAVRLVEKPTVRRAVVWGALLGALVLTRSLGLALVPALVLPGLELALGAGKGNRLGAAGRGLALGVLAGATALLFVLPWEMRNQRLHDQPIPGYAEAGAARGEIAEPVAASLDVLRQLLMQGAHLIVGAGILFVPLALPVVWRRRPIGSVARLALLSALLFSTASAYHHHLGRHSGIGVMIFGRYVAASVPLLLLVGLAGMKRPRLPAFVLAGLLVTLFPFPVYRDLETRFLLPLYWLSDSVWVVRVALLAVVATFAFLVGTGRRRLALVAVGLWFVVADGHALHYLHAIGLEHRPFVELGRGAATASRGRPVLLVGEGGPNSPASSADDWQARRSIAFWGGVDVRIEPAGDEALMVTSIPAGPRPAGPWVVPRRAGPGWRTLWGVPLEAEGPDGR